jgi:hypothetical protein
MYQIAPRKMTKPPPSGTTSVKVSPVISRTIGLVDFKDKSGEVICSVWAEEFPTRNNFPGATLKPAQKDQR